MNMFKFFNKKEEDGFQESSENHNDNSAVNIPENLFIEKENSTPKSDPVLNEKKKENKEPSKQNIELLYEFLARDYEDQGYNDALINPDSSNLEHGIIAIENERERILRKVKTFYEDFISEINFHIESRKRKGMIDVVEELEMKKGIAESHIEKIKQIEEEAKNKTGISQGPIISYSRGFNNGLAAISHHRIINMDF